MNTKDIESRLFAHIRIGIVDSVDKDLYRLIVRYPDSTTKIDNVIATPDAHLGYLPDPGTVVVMYDKPGWEKYVIGYLGILNEKTLDEVVASSENNPVHVPLKAMKSGDTYIGQYGRAYFNSSGDVAIGTFQNRANMFLKDRDASALIFGSNFEVSTTGRGLVMKSSSSVPDTFGDTFSIQRNISSSLSGQFLPDSLTVPPVTISEITLDPVGDMNFNVGYQTPTKTSPSSYLHMDVLGDISLGNSEQAILSIEASTQILLSNPSVSLELLPTGEGKLFNAASNIDISPLGVIGLQSYQSVSNPTPGASLTITGSSGTNVLSATVSNTFSAPSNNIGGILNLSGAFNMTGTGLMTSLNPLTLQVPGLTVSSPSTSFTGNTTVQGSTTIQGNTAIQGNTTIQGNTIINGVTTMVGAVSIIGLPSFTGLVSATPFISLSECAFIPVTVIIGGVPLIARIPVHL